MVSPGWDGAANPAPDVLGRGGGGSAPFHLGPVRVTTPAFPFLGWAGSVGPRMVERGISVGGLGQGFVPRAQAGVVWVV